MSSSAWKKMGFEVGAIVLDPRSAASGTCESELGISFL